MLILIATIMYLNKKHEKEIEFRNKMIEERDKEIAKLKKEKFNLRMALLEERNGADFSHLKYDEKEY